MSLSLDVVPHPDRSNVDTTTQEAVAGFEDVRHRLFGIAYQMLGRAADAEDIVQEAWVRWQIADRAQVRDRIGFLVTVTRRLALNAVTSARARREISVGEWLSEHDRATADPQLRAERGDAVGLALALLLGRLSPVERGVFMLREAFAFPFREIGEVLGISEPNARQVARRARIHLARQRHEPVDPTELDGLLDAFLDAARAGDVAGFIDLLTDTVDTRSAPCRPIPIPSRCRARPDRARLRTSGSIAALPRCVEPGTGRT